MFCLHPSTPILLIILIPFAAPLLRLRLALALGQIKDFITSLGQMLCKERNLSINNNAAAAAPRWAGIEKPQPITSRRHAVDKRAPPSLEAFRVDE